MDKSMPSTSAPDDRRTVDRMVWVLAAVCAVLLAIDWFVPKHGPFAIEHWFGFYGLFGLVACVGFILISKILRHIVIRPEDYYDD